MNKLGLGLCGSVLLLIVGSLSSQTNCFNLGTTNPSNPPVATMNSHTTEANIAQPNDWKEVLESQLPLLGHRNWIVVADSAYPLQTAPGIKTIYAGGDQLETVGVVLDAIKKANHVQGIVHVDKELDFVDEQYANGIEEYRTQLSKILDGVAVSKLEHEKIIAKLDEAGQAFHVLLIKTDLTLPYTSVFIRLDAGYWSDESENALRKAMQNAK